MKIILFAIILFSVDLSAANFFVDDTTLAGKYYITGDDFIEKAQYDSSLFYLEKAEKIFFDYKMWDKYVSGLNRISHSLRGLGNFDSALVISKHALEFSKEHCKDIKIIAQVYNQLGYSYKNLGDYESALLNAQKSKTILKDYTPNEIKAENYSLLGQIYKEKSDYDSSIYCFEKSIETKKEIRDDDPSVSTEYNNMALTLWEKGDSEKALEYFFKALELKINTLGEKHADVATLYSNIGANYFHDGENDLALEYYLKGLSIDFELLKKDHPDLGLRYNNIAMAYRVNGDFDLALDYAFKSRDILQDNFGEEHPNYATIMNNIGRIYSDKKDYEKALEFFIASYKIFQEIIGDAHPVTAQIQNNIGETYTKKGDYKKGLEYLKKSLSTRINSLGFKHPKVVVTLIETGKNYYSQGITDSAFYYFQNAVIASTDGFNETDCSVNPVLSLSRNDSGLLEALYLKAKTFDKKYSTSKKIKDLQNSFETYKLCSALAVDMRQSYKSRSSKFSISKTGFDIILDGITAADKLYKITNDNSFLETAFKFAEFGKAGVLSDALAEAHAKKFSGIPDSLLEKEKQLHVDLTSYDTQIQKEKEKKNGVDSTKLKKLEDSFFTLHREYENSVAYLEKNYNEYYNLKYKTHDYSVEEIKNNLNDKTAILEYVISDSLLYVFILTNKKVSLKKIQSKHNLKEDIILFRTSLFNIDFDTYANTAFKLYSVLIKSIENEITNIEKLYIIPDGILNYLPFESLLTANKTYDFDFSRLHYLINKYEISYYFSASSLYNKIKDKTKANSTFAGFAPVFGNDTETELKIASVIDTSVITNRSVDVEGKHYSSLPETEYEIKKISELFADKNIPFKIFLNISAKEEFIKSDLISDFGIVHIASHGFINENKPKLSGILFWIDDDTAYEDGILYSGEIYNLNLNADLVVLSACETGLGKIVKGEGIIGLTRGFIYSGAKNILVSLWQVADKSTSELMIEFYKNVLNRKSYSSSLREAKLKLIKEGTYSYPLEWAPFVLIGD